MKKILSVAALLVVAGAANAAVTGFAWRAVPNAVGGNGAAPGTDPVGGAAWTAGGPWLTFDLLVVGNVGDVINGVSFGGDGGPQRIFTNGTVFNHPVGGNTRSFATEGFFAALLFDTYACFGGVANPGGVGNSDGAATQFAGVTQLNGTGGQLQFTSFTQPPVALVADAAFGANGASLRVLRVTVSGNTTFLGGNGSIGSIGLPGGVTQDFSVSNAIPTPGALALMGLAGLATARRRR